MDRRRAAGVLLALAACVAYATAAPTASNHTSLDLYDGSPDGCYYNFQHYGEADRIMTNEPCLNCTCHNRMLMCYLRVCPFTKPIGQDCTIEKRADQCCPIVTCPDVPVDLLTSTTTSPAEYGATGLGKLEKYGCSIHGKYFAEGSKVPPTPNKPCEHCYCIRNMTTCVMQECTLHVDGCTPIYHKDVCCPVRYSCDHPEDEMPLLDDLSTTVRPTPGFLLTTTTLSPVTQMSQDCLYENQIIRDGALIKTEKACDHCYCMKGDIVCVVQECGTPMENEGKNCTALAPREGVCCPDTYICEGDEPTTGTYETDYTTELDKLTTLSPPRRAGSEGSGYRNEPDDIPNTESPTFETETEGSGYEQATIHPTVVTGALPDSHKVEPFDDISSNTVEPNEFIPITTTKEPVSVHVAETTESDVQKDTESQQFIPTTTSSYILPQVDDLTTKAQDEDIGSGEEDIDTPYVTVPTASALPAIEDKEPTVTIEQNVGTTEFNKEDGSETFEKEHTTSAPIVDEEKINVPKEQSASADDSAIDTTTETRRYIGEDEGVEASTTFDEEHDLPQSTSIPIIDDKYERKPTASPEEDKKTVDSRYSTTSIAPGFEDEMATTELQDEITDSFEGTVSDIDVDHKITITASTPLLEEIEKDTTDQENILVETTPEDVKSSTTSSNFPTEEMIITDSLKPDLIDETISTNIPTIDQHKTQENDVEDSSDPQQYAPATSVPMFDDEINVPSESLTTSKTQEVEANVEEGSEPQQYAPTTKAPIFEGEDKRTTASDTMATLKIKEGQETGVEESSEPEKYAPTTNAPVFEEEAQKTTPSDTITTSKIQENQVTDVKESSEPEQYAPTTSIPEYEDEVKRTTPSDTMTVSKAQEGQVTGVEESLEPEQYAPTTSVPEFEDEVKRTTPSDTMFVSKAQEGPETGVEESSEPAQYAPTTSAPVLEDEVKKKTPSDTMTTSKTGDGQEIDVEESSESQQYAPTTSAPVFEDEVKKITPSDTTTVSKTQEGQETGIEEGSEPEQYAPTTSAPVFEDEVKRTTPSDTMTTSKTQDSQETGVEESSEPGQYAPTTSAPEFADEVKKTTPSDTMTASKAQEGQETSVEESSEPEQYAPTTSAPVFEDEVKKTTQSDIETTSKTQEGQVTDDEDSSKPEYYAPTTSNPVFEDEVKRTTPSDTITASKAQEGQETGVEESSEPEQYAPTTSAPVFEDEAQKTTPSDTITTSKTQENQVTDVKESAEPEQYAPTTSIPEYEDEVKRTTPSDTMTVSKAQEGQVTGVEESLEPEQYAPTTSAPVLEDEVKRTTPSDTMFVSKAQEGPETGVEESSEPEQYAPTVSAPVFEDEAKKTTPSDTITTSKAQEGQVAHVEDTSEPQQYSPTTSAYETKKTTAEPEGLNTIPSGSVEKETTESAGIEKYTHTDEIAPTAPATELENKLDDVTRLADTSEHTTSIPNTSASQEDQLIYTTESTVKENVDKIGSIETHDINEQTTVLPDIYDETISTLTHDHSSSTKLPASEYEQSYTSPVPFNTENIEQTADSETPITTSTYEYSTQASGAEDSTPEKHEIITSSPSYATVPASTLADLDENEIINESRIPGEGDCLLNGVTYRNESAVPSINKCQSGCRCSSSIIKCDPIICSPPPEYMDNCQTTYDSLDSCCPTYVCDHKTETIPPQSHSQMSGTEAPVESPVKCNGDECVLSEDKKQPGETSELCQSGSCTNEDVTSSHPFNISEQPAVDRHEECTGNKCTSIDSPDQLCTEENGCQVSPVKPCEGTGCEDTSYDIPPQKQQPCTSDNCDVPAKDCSGGKCVPGDEDNLDIEKECTDKSCKRKDDSELGQKPPKICSGSECESTQLISDMEVTTADIITEKIETSSKSPSTEFIQSDIVSKPLLTTILPDVTTKLPDLDSNKDEISTIIYESATLSENQDGSVPYLPETTKIIDDVIDTKGQTIPDTDFTEKLEYDITTKAVYTKSTEIPDLSYDKESTAEPQEVTKAPVEIDDQDAITNAEQQTTPPEKHLLEDTPTSTVEEMVTKSPQVHYTATSEADDGAISTAPSEDEATTKTSAVYDMEDTKLPQLSDESTKANEDIGSTTSKTYDVGSHDLTKSPQVTSASEDATTQIADIVGAETLKPHVTDLEEITNAPKDSESEGTTAKSTDAFVTLPEVSDIQKPTTLAKGSDDITKHHLEEPSTEASKPYDSEKTDVTESTESIHSETTTISLTDDLNAEASKPTDTNVQEVTQSPKETDSVEPAEEMGAETAKPFDTPATTLISENTENEEPTKKSTFTEQSPVAETEKERVTKTPEVIEFTTLEVIDEPHTEAPKDDEIPHGTTIAQQDIETDVTVSKIKDETFTEPSKPNESELFSTTKSPSADFDNEETTAKITKETDKEPLSDNLEPEAVTKPSESDSVPQSDVTTIKSPESDSLEKSSTSQPDTVPELATQTTSSSDSKGTETERTGVYEKTTSIYEQSQPTESIIDSATESLEEGTTTSSPSPIHKEVDMTSISDHDIISTESPLDLVTKLEPHSEDTVSPDKPGEEGETIATEIDTSTSDETVTDLPKVQDTETSDEIKETTLPEMELDEITQKPAVTSEDTKIQEDTEIEIPNSLENEKDTISEEPTSKPSDTADVSYAVDMKTEQPEKIDYTKEEELPSEKLDKATKEPPTLEKATTEFSIDPETKLPVDLDLEPESYTDKPTPHEHKQDSSGKDESKTETTLANEFTTVTFEDELTEKTIGIDKKPETTQYQDINTKPTESEEETYTKIPLHGSSSETTDIGATHLPEQSDDKELTTPTIKTSELTTESSNIYTPTESSEKTALETEVTEKITVESSSIRDGTKDSETQTMVPTVHESSTQDQPIETESSEVDITTAKPIVTETEKIYEPVTVSVEEVTKDTEVKTPGQTLEPSQPTSTESAEQMTKAQDQGDSENVEVVTETSTSDSIPPSPTIIKTTTVPEVTETSTQLLDMISSSPDEDIEMSTLKHEISAATTSGQIENESVSPIDKDTTEIPATVFDQQTEIEIVTEPQIAPIDTATKKQEPTTELVEEEFMPSKPDMYLTTSSAVDESAKSTPSPVEEASTAPEQGLPTSIEPHVTEGEQPITVSDPDIASTPKIPEIETQTERVTTPTESPSQPELSPVTSAPEEEKRTTAKAEEFSSASPLFDKFTKPTRKPTEAPATEQPRPIPTEEQPTDDLLTPDEDPSIPPSGTSGYGTDPDYMEEDQTFGPGTCRYGGKVYVSAQQIPRDDPCDFCFCFRSDIICLQQSCPPPIHGCHEEPISGFCCPRYECPVSMATTVNVTTTTTTTTTTLPPHFPVHSYKGSAQKRGCLIKGHTYKVGEVVRASSGPCLHCTCGGDGQMKCDPKQCTPEPMLRQMIAAAVSAKRRR